MGFSRTDATLVVTKSLPASDGTEESDSIDLEHDTNGDFVAPVEVKLTAPALTTTELPDSDTATYTLEHSSDDSSFSTIPGFEQVMQQLGAGGAGAATESATMRLPVDVDRYIRATVTTAGTAGDCSDSDMTLRIYV